MTRYFLCEMIQRQIYNGQPTDDAGISIGLINAWLEPAIAAAAQKNYTDNYKLDGVAYVNNSFYTTYSSLAITTDNTDLQLYSLTTPHVPYGIGRLSGIAQVRLKDSTGSISFTGVPLDMQQFEIADRMRQIPNRFYYCPEGPLIRIKSILNITAYTGIVKMVSGGDSTNINSTLNVPNDYIPGIIEYLKANLSFQRGQKKDIANDGSGNE